MEADLRLSGDRSGPFSICWGAGSRQVKAGPHGVHEIGPLPPSSRGAVISAGARWI